MEFESFEWIYRDVLPDTGDVVADSLRALIGFIPILGWFWFLCRNPLKVYADGGWFSKFLFLGGAFCSFYLVGLGFWLAFFFLHKIGHLRGIFAFVGAVCGLCFWLWGIARSVELRAWGARWEIMTRVANGVPLSKEDIEGIEMIKPTVEKFITRLPETTMKQPLMKNKSQNKTNGKPELHLLSIKQFVKNGVLDRAALEEALRPVVEKMAAANPPREKEL